MKGAISTLKGLLHAHNLFHGVINAQHVHIQSTGIAYDAKNGHVHAINFVNLEALTLQIGFHFCFTVLGRSRFEYNYHKISPFFYFLVEPVKDIPRLILL